MIRPLRDLLVIKPEKEPGMLGLLVIPDMGTSSNKTSCVCKVMAVGPGFHPVIQEGNNKGLLRSHFVKTTAKVGDRVLVPAYGSHPAGDEVICDGETMTMIQERDIVGILP